MNRWRWTALLMIAIAAMSPGCDRAPAPPPQASDAAETDPKAKQDQQEARPTTQELLAGTFKPIALPSMPLTLNVPESWKIETGEKITFLGGPTPADRAMINLVSHGVRTEQPDVILRGMKAEMARMRNDARNRADLRDLGKAKVLERFWVEAPVSNPKLNDRGEPILDKNGGVELVSTTPIRWTLTVFLPVEKAFLRYELSFLGLTVEQYATDKELLDKIVSSLNLDEPGTAPAAGMLP